MLRQLLLVEALTLAVNNKFADVIKLLITKMGTLKKKPLVKLYCLTSVLARQMLMAAIRIPYSSSLIQ
jgi:hypothetical protein